MQALSRRLGQQSFNSAASISSLRPTYSISDAGYGLDYPRYGSTLASRGSGYVLRKGTGGRSSVSGIIATVFGATGFLGIYLVQQLAKMGSQVFVPFRGSEDSPRHLKLMGDLGQIVPMKYNPRDENSIKAAMAKANVVINLIGREYETRNYSFEEVNHHMAEQLALATIMRPSTMIGTEDRILNRWAHFAKNYSFLPLIGDGSTRIQPVYVVDVAAAIVAALKDDSSSMGKIYELGGPEVFTIRELAELMYDTIREYPHYMKVPFPIAKILASPREIFLKKVPFPLPTPNIFNLDEIHALSQDTLVSENALTFSDLDIVPHKLKGYPVEYLAAYRKGGPQFGSTISEKVSPDAYP
ncbi:NADH dehydrogenase [ubiquinone] 1 alpha subcomplex subunit 9, mitochondrial-like protein [Drosera capensis]